MLYPGFEPGLPVPQTGVLTTRPTTHLPADASTFVSSTKRNQEHERTELKNAKNAPCRD